MNNFREAILVPRELIENSPEVMTAIIKGAQKAGLDWAELVGGGGMGGMEQVADAGRHGDTELAHVTPEEGQMLEAMGGSGTVNPETGLREYFSDDPNDRSTDYGGGGGGSVGGGQNEGGGTQTGGGYVGGGPTGGSGRDYGRSSAGTVGGGQNEGGGSGARPGEGGSSYAGAGLTPDIGGGQGQSGSDSAPQGSGTQTAWGGVNQQVAGNRWTDAQGRTWVSTGPASVNAGAFVGALAPIPGGAVAGQALGKGLGLPNFNLGYGKKQIDPRTGIDIVGANDRDGPQITTRSTGGGTFAAPAAASYRRPAAMTPSDRFGFDQGMTPLQQRVAIASRGTSGLDSFYRTQEAQDYFNNLLARSLVFDDGTLGNLSEIRPIENAYMDLMGYAPRTSTQSLLESIAGT